MKDRVSEFPGRVKVTKSDGTVEYVIVERADRPIEEGTPLNKATLLTDDVAELLGLQQENPTVNDALLGLFNFSDGKAKVASGSYVGTGVYGSANPTVIDFPFTPKLVIFNAPYAGDVVVFPYIYGSECFYATRARNSVTSFYEEMATITGPKMSFYAPSGNAALQLNQSGIQYEWVIIG